MATIERGSHAEEQPRRQSPLLAIISPSI